jgi:putative ABC transport system ATP-binding protein
MPVASESQAPASDRTAVLAARGLTKVYGSGEVEVRALRGVDLDLYEAELVVLLGPSGSGKSTLLNIIGGLDRPSAGQVLFRGDDLVGYDEAHLTRYWRDHVGFVFQFYNLIPSLTAEENVALVAEIAAGEVVLRYPSDRIADGTTVVAR